jgi:hypothetical protein
MTKDEALAMDLALEALERLNHEDSIFAGEFEKEITAIKQVRALDKKAENARALGLDYEPVAIPDCGEAGHADGACGNRECLPSFRRNTTPPAAPVQEPLAWLYKDDWGRTKIAFSKETANEWGTEVQPLYTIAAQPAPVQEPVCGVTDEENEKFSRDVSNFKGADPEATKYALEQFLKNRKATPPAQRTEPPPWWPAVENILNEYGLQAIDFVADFKAAEQSQRTWVGSGDLEDSNAYQTPPAQPAPVQEPVVFYRCNGCGHAYEQFHPTSCDCMEAGGFDRVEYYATPPAPPAPVQERNFCERCGKRIGDYIHTCTPPLKENT